MKQRLLGAAVLIALAIIFVPMFLSSPGPRTSADTSNLQAPETPDRRFQERTLSLDLPRSDGNPAATPDAAPDPNRITTVDTATAPKSEPAAEQFPVDAPAATVTDAMTPSPTQTPVPASEPATANEPVEILPGTAANGRFFVHMGDYGAKKNAIDLAAMLKKAGYAGFSEESSFGGKPTLRVRVGPFANRADAEATRLRISQGTFRAPATVVQNASDAKTPKPVEPGSSAPKPAAQKSDASETAVNTTASSAANAGGWVVQLNAFSDVDDANALRDSVRAASFPAYVDKVTREGRTLWRVRVGPQADRNSAEAVQAQLRERLKKDGVVVANP